MHLSRRVGGPTSPLHIFLLKAVPTVETRNRFLPAKITAAHLAYLIHVSAEKKKCDRVSNPRNDTVSLSSPVHAASRVPLKLTHEPACSALAHTHAYVHMHMRAHNAHAFTCMHMHSHACTCMHMHVHPTCTCHMCTCTCTCDLHIHVHGHVCASACACAHVHVATCAHHGHAHAHAHTCTCTRMHIKYGCALHAHVQKYKCHVLCLCVICGCAAKYFWETIFISQSTSDRLGSGTVDR